MVVSASAFTESTDGYQQLSSGLYVNKGQIDAGLLRATGSKDTGGVLWPRDGAGSGSGLELAHYPKLSSNVQSYDRDTSTWLDLNLYGKNIGLNPQGGKVSMPAGSAQALLGYYWNPVGWTVPQVNVWTESPVQASFTSSGTYPWRIEWGCTIGNPTKGAVVYVGVGIDGAITFPSLALFHVPEANYLTTVSGTAYLTTPPAAGPHRAGIFIYTGTAGTAINAGAYATLWVTEQRA